MLPISILIDASLSARRAWIEIYKLRIHQKQEKVALRKESVDRNKAFSRFLIGCIESLSARRAWIEIETPQTSS